MIHLILLSGGSGTRLWPLSNEARAKQFLKVLRNDVGDHVSMVQRVYEQISLVEADLDVTIATAASQAESIKQQIAGDYSMVIEPERRDTAPAIMLACSHLMSEQGAHPDDTIVVMPIDAFVDQDYFERISDIDLAVQEDEFDLVLLGVEPVIPSEKYGYIVPERKSSGIMAVRKFVEKPTKELASRLIDAGALWNCGVFAFRLRYGISLIEAYSRDSNFSSLCRYYKDLPKTSFDYEVVECASSVGVLSYSGVWKDLGTWNTLTEEMADRVAGRVVMDDATCSNNHVINETGLPLVISGISNSVIVATPDGLLVSGKEESSSLKPLIAKAAESRPMYEKRQWGEYRVLDSSVYSNGVKSITKELILRRGRQLSYQSHSNRAEVWTIADGEGRVVVGNDEMRVSQGDVVKIPPNAKHAAFAEEDLHIIEVQLGNQLEEADIERFGFFW